MKKLILLGLGTVVMLVVAGLVVFSLKLGPIVKAGIETVGPRVTKCPVTVENIDVKPLRGIVRIRNLVVGNPEGFKTDSAFSIGEVRVSIVLRSLLSDEIVIREIAIDAPQITYEIGMGKTNIGTLKANVEEFIASVTPTSGAEKPKDTRKDDKAGKKVTIDHVVVSGGQVRLSGTILQGSALPLPLPTVELNDIGKGDSVSTAEAAAKILDAVLGGVVDVVKQSGQMLKDAAGNIGNTAKSTGDSLKKGVGGLVKGVFGGDK